MTKIIYRDIIEDTLSKHYNVADQYKNNTVEENREICRKDHMGFGVGALSVTGDLNIGIMIRTACLMGANDFFIFGRRKYDKRSTVGAQNYIDIHKYGHGWSEIKSACNFYGYYPVFVEQGGVTLPLDNFTTQFLEYKLEDSKPMFIFGSEGEGINLSEMLEHFPDGRCLTISLPQHGVLRSYNVSTSMAIICWEWISGRIIPF